MSPSGHLTFWEVLTEALPGTLCTLALFGDLHLGKAPKKRRQGLKPNAPCQTECLWGPLTLNLLGTSKETEGLDPARSHRITIPGRLHVLVHQLPGRLPAQTLHSFGTVLPVTAHLSCQQSRVLERLVVDRPAGNGSATLGNGLLE